MKKRDGGEQGGVLRGPRDLPSVEALSQSPLLGEARELHGADFVTSEARAVLEEAREALRRGEGPIMAEDLPRRVLGRMEAILKGGLGPVINATGTILHTNLGRSVLSDEAICKSAMAGAAYTSLEFETVRGGRGERDAFSAGLLCRLTGAESACVVNNNAAALLITLNTLAEGKEVIISRGELVEIGGSFRLPEIIEKSGCILREVGTTNRTHPEDYLGAIGGDTALILKVHRSNYTIEGFTKEVSLRDLVAIGREHGLPVVEDLGAGALVDLGRFGLPPEPLVSGSIGAGVDAVTFSGDKLLGGPQSGLIAGKASILERVRKNPLKRALRCDKLCLAALEETLKLYLNPEALPTHLPPLGLMVRPLEDIEDLAVRAADLINSHESAGLTARVCPAKSVIGGGSLPGRSLPTMVVAIEGGPGPILLHKAFLSATPPVVGRISKDAFVLDPRTVLDEEEFLGAIKDTLCGLEDE